MTPTMHLRFVERTEIVEENGDLSMGRPVRILQQFWETPTGSDAIGDMFIQIYGFWRDVPVVKE